MNKPSILSFDAVSAAEIGSPLALTNPDGTATGLTVTVLGDNSDAVQKHVAKVVREVRAAEAIALKSGKQAPFDLEKLKEQNVEGAAVRVIGWDGVDEQFDRELLKKALRRNPHWINQIIDHSGDIGNFTGKA